MYSINKLQNTLKYHTLLFKFFSSVWFHYPYQGFSTFSAHVPLIKKENLHTCPLVDYDIFIEIEQIIKLMKI